MNQAAATRKIKDYTALVEDVKQCSLCHNLKGKVHLEGCPFCEEINLWSYWEGGVSHLDASILVVGQDWGFYRFDDHIRAVIESRQDNSALNGRYMNNNKSITDRNLAALLASIGYDVLRDNERAKELFFTNFVLCYRTEGLSGNFQNAWIRNCSVYFGRLTAIIQPKVILCLGRRVYDGVMLSLNGRETVPGWKIYNDRIDAQLPSIVPKSRSIIFPMAHCGMMGTNTRNRGKVFKDILDVQKQDWHTILQYL